jgi:hypothetical protein
MCTNEFSNSASRRVERAILRHYSAGWGAGSPLNVRWLPLPLRSIAEGSRAVTLDEARFQSGAVKLTRSNS